MFVYSKKIVQFIEEIKEMARDILSREVRLRVGSNCFFNRQQTSMYRISVTIYNDQARLGYFDPEFSELGFHECLMHASKTHLRNVIRHELAHYITWINFKGTVPFHCSEFKTICLRMGWGEEVSSPSICQEGGQNICNIEENGILRKVQKLMALTSSSSQNEAEQAMIKAQQILLKHNIDSKYVGDESDEKFFLKRILKQPKKDAKMCAIARILDTFFVSTVYNRSKDFMYLDVLGDATNVEIAEYVANFLTQELDNLWNLAKKQTHLKGITAKNSFFLGIAKGYCDKIESLKRGYDQKTLTAIMVIEKTLTDATSMAYERLSYTTRKANYCLESGALGEQMGRKMNINPAIHKSSKDSGAFISHSTTE